MAFVGIRIIPTPRRPQFRRKTGEDGLLEPFDGALVGAELVPDGDEVGVEADGGGDA